MLVKYDWISYYIKLSQIQQIHPRTTSMLTITARFSLLPLITAFILTFLMACPSPAKLIDKVVAVVNGEVITSIELEQAAQAIVTKLRQTTSPAELPEALAEARKATLDELIEGLLIIQKARE